MLSMRIFILAGMIGVMGGIGGAGIPLEGADATAPAVFTVRQIQISAQAPVPAQAPSAAKELGSNMLFLPPPVVPKTAQ